MRANNIFVTFSMSERVTQMNGKTDSRTDGWENKIQKVHIYIFDNVRDDSQISTHVKFNCIHNGHMKSSNIIAIWVKMRPTVVEHSRKVEIDIITMSVTCHCFINVT